MNVFTEVLQEHLSLHQVVLHMHMWKYGCQVQHFDQSSLKSLWETAQMAHYKALSMHISKREFLHWLAAISISAGCSSNSRNDQPANTGQSTNPESDIGDTTNQISADEMPVWKATGLEVPGLASFDSTMQSFMQARNIPGGSLAVTRGGKLALARGYSYSADPAYSTVNPMSLFRIASISKPITGTAIMRLVQDGQLDLSARLRDVLSLTVYLQLPIFNDRIPL